MTQSAAHITLPTVVPKSRPNYEELTLEHLPALLGKFEDDTYEPTGSALMFALRVKSVELAEEILRVVTAKNLKISVSSQVLLDLMRLREGQRASAADIVDALLTWDKKALTTLFPSDVDKSVLFRYGLAYHQSDMDDMISEDMIPHFLEHVMTTKLCKQWDWKEKAPRAWVDRYWTHLSQPRLAGMLLAWTWGSGVYCETGVGCETTLHEFVMKRLYHSVFAKWSFEQFSVCFDISAESAAAKVGNKDYLTLSLFRRCFGTMNKWRSHFRRFLRETKVFARRLFFKQCEIPDMFIVDTLKLVLEEPKLTNNGTFLTILKTKVASQGTGWILQNMTTVESILKMLFVALSPCFEHSVVFLVDKVERLSPDLLCWGSLGQVLTTRAHRLNFFRKCCSVSATRKLVNLCLRYPTCLGATLLLQALADPRVVKIPTVEFEIIMLHLKSHFCFSSVIEQSNAEFELVLQKCAHVNDYQVVDNA